MSRESAKLIIALSLAVITFTAGYSLLFGDNEGVLFAILVVGFPVLIVMFGIFYFLIGRFFPEFKVNLATDKHRPIISFFRDKILNVLSKFRKCIDFNKSPIRSGVFSGVIVSVLLILCVAFMSIFLIAMENFDEGVGGAVGVIAFLLLPLVFYAGAPWSIFMYEVCHYDYLLFGVFAGLIVNGVIVGFIFGMVVKIKKH